jgi:multiple sugar transport system substrate-binding protein
VINLNDYINSTDTGMTLVETLDFPLVFWEQDQVNGYRFGIPIQRTGEVLFYNRSWAKELGFSEPPSTPEEVKAQACAAARLQLKDLDPNNRGTGGWIINTDPLPVISWMFAFGADRMPDDPTGEYQLNTPAIVQAFTFLHDLFDQGCAWISRMPDPALYFANRQALFYSGSLIDIPLQARVMDNAGNKDEWLVLPYPHTDGIPVLVVSGSSLAIIHATPKEQMAAWLFSRWLLNPERLARLDAASGSFPVRISSLDYLDDFRQQHPQWSQAISWLVWAQPAPRQPSWRAARWVISDAAWNVFNPNILPTPISFILEQAETTIPEILNPP